MSQIEERKNETTFLPSHGPGAMRHPSNLGHIVEGALFAIVGLCALLRNPGSVRVGFVGVAGGSPSLGDLDAVPALCASPQIQLGHDLA